MRLSSIIKESKNFQSHNFIKTVDNVLSLLSRESGRIGNFTIFQRLIKLDPRGEAIVVGDLHGDLNSLLHILEDCGFERKMISQENSTLIFLGDYGDRGKYSAEVYYVILKLKLAFPDRIVLLRGNHEGPNDLLAYPHDLPRQFKAKFKQNWQMAYKKTRELFNYLYNAVLVEKHYLMVHGGLSAKITMIQDLASASHFCPENKLLEDLLWSDPIEMNQDALNSPRGAGKLFGKAVTEKVLKKVNAKILIRGHEQCEKGFKINHDGKVLTLFSTKGYPYLNEYGAYLQLPLSEDYKRAEQLIPWIHSF